MNQIGIYPIRVTGTLDPGVGRWLWLVKWLLAIPHFIVLLFLWLAVAIVTVVAFFAILFTARYPRGLFDFSVGVMRWTWRVGYYSYSALGTDRYPPFSLRDDPDYPARLEVEYPERLSRGLVLVKWWLLAIPHYLVLAAFSGTQAIGLNRLLVCLAAIALLFTARYPKGIFDFIMGINRWTIRVAAYALLMTDEYPPFRLDQGDEEPRPDPMSPAGPTDANAAAGNS